jgi:hypothetical protein
MVDAHHHRFCALPAAVAALALLCATVATATAQSADPAVHVLPVADLARGERRPLLIFLHGLGGSGAEALNDPGLRALAEQGRMVLVAPDGTLDRAGRRFWNAGRACCNFDGKAVDDLAEEDQAGCEKRAPHNRIVRRARQRRQARVPVASGLCAAEMTGPDVGGHRHPARAAGLAPARMSPAQAAGDVSGVRGNRRVLLGVVRGRLRSRASCERFEFSSVVPGSPPP